MAGSDLAKRTEKVLKPLFSKPPGLGVYVQVGGRLDRTAVDQSGISKLNEVAIQKSKAAVK